MSHPDVTPAVADEFAAGMADAFDPQPLTSAPADGEQITSLASWWHTAYCDHCGHTFRRGDRVRLESPTGPVRHLDPRLGCLSGADEAGTASEVLEFIEAIQLSFPPAPNLVVRRTQDEPYLLAPPESGFRRQVCLFCAHTFRPGELVIVCPCTPDQRLCRRAVHRDPAQGLVCWETWRPGNRLMVCPVTLTRLER